MIEHDEIGIHKISTAKEKMLVVCLILYLAQFCYLYIKNKKIFAKMIQVMNSMFASCDSYT